MRNERRIPFLLFLVCLVAAMPYAWGQVGLEDVNLEPSVSLVWVKIDALKAGVTLCHIPPDDPKNRQTIAVGQTAVAAHLAHGDYLGECASACNGVLVSGDIVVVEGGGCFPPAVLRVKPLSGAQSIISQGGEMSSPSSVFLDSRGDLIVSDRNGALIRINAADGSQSRIVTLAGVMRGVAEETDGSLLVLQQTRLWRVDPDSGSSALVTSGNLLTNAFGLIVDAYGSIYATNLFSSPSLVRIDPLTGTQQLVVASSFNSLYGLSVDSDGDHILVTENRTSGNAVADDAILRINKTTGESTVVWDKGYAAIDVDLFRNGDLLILDQGPGSGCNGLRSMLLRFDRNTGMTETIVVGGLMIDTQAALIAPFCGADKDGQDYSPSPGDFDSVALAP